MKRVVRRSVKNVSFALRHTNNCKPALTVGRLAASVRRRYLAADPGRGAGGVGGREDIRYAARVPRAGRPEAAEGGQDAGVPPEEEGEDWQMEAAVLPPQTGRH